MVRAAKFSMAKNKVRIFAAEARLASVKRNKSLIHPTYIIPTAIKEEIHHHISKIRDCIETADLREDKKDVLFSRLNKFTLEVDKNRTKAEALGSLYIGTMKTIGDGAKELEPVIKSVERIYKAMSKAKEEVVKVDYIKKKDCII